MSEILIVSIGPDAADMLTIGAAEALRGAGRLLLRTGRHGVADWLRAQGVAFETLDALYAEADDFDALNERAADAVLAAGEGLCYAVPDPATDATVTVLKARGVAMRVLPGVTQEATARAQALSDPMPVVLGGFRAITAADFGPRNISPSMALIITELSSRLLAGEVKLALLDVYAPEMRVLFEGREIPLDELDRQKAYSHISSVYIPESPMGRRDRYLFGDLLEIMARLRRPGDGCPWDIEQTHESLRPYVIEEAYELVEAIDSGDMDRVADELGDVLLQVVFHARIAREHAEFDINDVTTAICHKMITRHAHIFGDVVCETSEDVLRSWDAIKRREKGHKATTDVLRDVPGHLPALMRAHKVQAKARQVGFDWDTAAEALEKVGEEAAEVRAELAAGRDPEGELGDLLFATVNAARLAGVDAEVALGGATEKFIRRFAAMEGAIVADGKQMRDMTLAEMDVYWDAVKRAEEEAIR